MESKRCEDMDLLILDSKDNWWRATGGGQMELIYKAKMNATEKAKDIYDSMKGFRVTNKHRKKCATVCITEMLKSHDCLDLTTDVDKLEAMVEYNYLLDVRDEIQKL